MLGLIHLETIEDAIAFVNSGAYGNMACVFTSSGANARKFRYEAEVGTSGSTSALRRPWPFSRSAGRARAFSAICTGKAATPSSSSPKQKLWSNAGPKRGAESFKSTFNLAVSFPHG